MAHRKQVLHLAKVVAALFFTLHSGATDTALVKQNFSALPSPMHKLSSSSYMQIQHYKMADEKPAKLISNCL